MEEDEKDDKTDDTKAATLQEVSEMKQTIASQNKRMELLEQENSKWNGENLEEVVTMRNRLQTINRNMLGMEQENNHLVNEVRITKERYKSEVEQLEKSISEEAKATVNKVKQIEKIVLQKN